MREGERVEGRRYAGTSRRVCFHPCFDVNETSVSHSSNRPLFLLPRRKRQQRDAIKIFHDDLVLFHDHRYSVPGLLAILCIHVNLCTPLRSSRKPSALRRF